MRAGTVQIVWHDTKPVLTVDFHPTAGILATGGADKEIKIWKIVPGEAEKKLPTATYQSFLSYHSTPVNALRFSPSGEFLASGADGGELILWKWLTTDDGQTCKVHKTLAKPEKKTKGKDKINFVCQHVISKAEQQAADDAKVSKNHLFHDETLPSFFRRLAWSPDGSFLITPAGSYKFSPASESVNTAYVFARKDFSRPALQLPGASKPVVAVCFCPVAFILCGTTSGSGFFKLPYRLVFALATLNSLYIYDTESANPIAILAGLHYAAITDIAWSPDAKYLALSSQDGYCTLVEFDAEELGSLVPLAGKGMATDGSRCPVSEDAQQMEVKSTGNVATVADKMETDEKQEKASPAPASMPVQASTLAPDKAARRRITPMAIDP